MDGDGWSVGEVAQLAGVTVRTLHHWDEVGLLSPAGRTTGGYRRYTEADLTRLRRVLLYRELGFGLQDIGVILAADPVTHLRRQHGLLRERIERLTAVLAAVERELEATTVGIHLTPEEQFEVFGEHRPADHEQEVRHRWGDTEAYRESRRRTGRYDKDDWRRITAEGDDINARLATALRTGEPADGPVATGLAEEHRAYLDRWFYACDQEMHRCVAELWVSDPRFTATYEAIAPGLAEYAYTAVLANA